MIWSNHTAAKFKHTDLLLTNAVWNKKCGCDLSGRRAQAKGRPFQFPPAGVAFGKKNASKGILLNCRNVPSFTKVPSMCRHVLDGHYGQKWYERTVD